MRVRTIKDRSRFSRGTRVSITVHPPSSSMRMRNWSRYFPDHMLNHRSEEGTKRGYGADFNHYTHGIGSISFQQAARAMHGFVVLAFPFLRREIALKSANPTCPETCGEYGRSAVASFKTDPDPYDGDAHAALIAAPPGMRAAIKYKAGIAQ